MRRRRDLGRGALACVLVWAWTTGAWAEGTDRRIAVLDFAARGVAAEVAANITEVVAAALAQVPGYGVISKADILSMIDLQGQRQMLGCDDQSCLVEIGGTLGADLLVRGAIGRTGDVYSISLSAVSAHDGAPFGRAQQEVTVLSDLPAAARKAVAEMMKLEKPIAVRSGRGGIFVDTEPSGAQVFLDGTRQATNTPLEIGGVAAGDHMLRLVKGDLERLVPVLVEPDAITKLAVQLAVVKAKFLSVPFDARVFVDGVERGATPLLIADLPAARHRIEMRKRGYKTHEEEVLFELTPLRKAGGEAFEVKAELRPLPVRLNVESVPPDAKVYLDGSVLGTTPLDIPGVDPGARTLVLERPGFRREERKVTIRPGEAPRLTVSLAEFRAHQRYMQATALRRDVRFWGIIGSAAAIAVGAGFTAGGWVTQGDAQARYAEYLREIAPERIAAARQAAASANSAAWGELGVGYSMLGIGVAALCAVLFNELTWPTEPDYTRETEVIGEVVTPRPAVVAPAEGSVGEVTTEPAAPAQGGQP